MILAEMTSPEVDALPRDIVVLMPVASCEQHSLHLPVFTDSLIGQEVARRVHERCRTMFWFCRCSGLDTLSIIYGIPAPSVLYPRPTCY